ncbi:hypothetical protein IJ135_02450 [Candidatus Saccharibacteria bacterium]|nr:hypothetical protein [Candidatus Saccharibacteria bacterium]
MQDIPEKEPRAQVAIPTGSLLEPDEDLDQEYHSRVLGAREHVLEPYREDVEWYKLYRSELMSRGIRVDFLSILGFNPQYELKKAEQAIRRAENSLKKRDNGLFVNPKCSFTQTWMTVTKLGNKLPTHGRLIHGLPSHIENDLYGTAKEYLAYEALLAANSRFAETHPGAKLAFS